MERGHALDLGRRKRAGAQENRLAAWLRRPRRRREADALLRASGGHWEEHSAVAWRVAELTSRYERRRLARSLVSVFDDLLDPRPGSSASVLCRPRIRPYASELLAIAELLADLSRPVTGAGIVLVHDLLRDPGSPIYLGGAEAKLSPTLDCIHDTLEAA
jgi:hypothetical protein